MGKGLGLGGLGGLLGKPEEKKKDEIDDQTAKNLNMLGLGGLMGKSKPKVVETPTGGKGGFKIREVLQSCPLPVRRELPEHDFFKKLISFNVSITMFGIYLVLLFATNIMPPIFTS